MSLSWREHVRIALFPDRIVLVRLGRGLRPRVQASAVVPVTTACGWQSVLAQLAETLKQPEWQHTDATVLFSGHFVRTLLHAGSRVRLNGAEREAMLRHRFEESYGDTGEAWEVRLGDADGARSSVACAVEKDLLARLRDTLKAAGLRLRSVQPLLIPIFNALRHRLDGNPQWLLIDEPGLLCAALAADGQWRSLRTQLTSADSFAEDARLLLEREALLAGYADTERRVIHCALDASAKALSAQGGWTFEPWWPQAMPGLALTEQTRFVAALAGAS